MAAPMRLPDAAILVVEALTNDEILDAADILYRRNEVLRMQEKEREGATPHSPVRVKNYVEEIVPLYSQEEFKTHFRMHTETFYEASVTCREENCGN
ncbi:hypothetical protein E2C01_054802 [Portunus trituberculatus]|uniref:Uncharacterized protein n=1 Tax=Portunus trituberculatus TaxID=210409 RepID=A0A5B7GT65_PORTR|nr:hypothetical protein [Portunus trituberculatus]